MANLTGDTDSNSNSLKMTTCIKTHIFMSRDVIYQDSNTSVKYAISLVSLTLTNGEVFEQNITISFHPCLLQADMQG